MAKVRDQLLGKLSGSVGDVVYRQVDGMNIACRRPGSFMPGTDPKSVERRTKFAAAVRFSRAIYSVDDLKMLWQEAAQSKRRGYNLILRTNLEMISSKCIIDSAAITPPAVSPSCMRGFHITCTGVSVTADGLEAQVDAGDDTGGGFTIERQGKTALYASRLAYVVCLTGPADEKMPKVQFLSGTSETAPLTTDRRMTFRIALSGRDAAAIRNCSDKKIFLALLVPGPAGSVAGYSGTAVYQLS